MNRCKDINKIISICDFNDDEMILKNGKRLVILKVEPINYKLKSKSEQEAILESYKSFLKQCNFDFQIFIQTEKANVNNHIKAIQKNILYEPEIADIANDYINLIRDISEVRGSISRKFYIILNVDDNNKEARVTQVVDGLKSCGNYVEKCNRNNIFNILKKYFKKTQTVL